MRQQSSSVGPKPMTMTMTSTGISPVSESGGRNGVPVKLLTEHEVADRLRVSLGCLRRWRLQQSGPRFRKVGSLVRYPDDELNHWIESLPAGGAPRPSDRG